MFVLGEGKISQTHLQGHVETLYSLFFDKRTLNIFLHEFIQGLVDEIDVHKFGTALANAINHTKFWIINKILTDVSLQFISFINVFNNTKLIPAKVERKKERVEVLYNYNEEIWQKVDTRTNKIIQQ